MGAALKGTVFKTLLLWAGIVVPVVGGLWFNLSRELDYQLRLLRVAQESQIEVEHTALAERFQSVFSDVLLLSSLQGVKAWAGRPNDRQIQSSLVRDLYAFLHLRGVYDQVRLLDLDGMERIRLNYNDGDIVFVHESELQSKARRYYFYKARNLRQDRVYVSRLDLNVEKDVIERPFKPTMRFATPVFGPTGRRLAVLVVNYLADDLLDMLRETAGDGPGKPLLVNDEGEWIMALDPKDSFGFMFPESAGPSFAERFPRVWTDMRDREQGAVRSREGLFTFRTLYPAKLRGEGVVTHQGESGAPGASPYHFNMVSFVPEQAISERTWPIVRETLVAGGFLAVLTLGFSWLVVTLAQRRRAAQEENISKGRELARINTSLRSEMQQRESAQRVLMENQNRLRMIMDAAADGILAVDADGRIESANPAAGRLFEYPPSALEGMSIVRLVPEEAAPRHERFFSTGERLEEMSRRMGGAEVWGVARSGRRVPVEITLSRTERAGEPLFIAVIRDVAARQEVDRLKSEFVSTVNHELRTPLTSILGALGLLEGGAVGQLPGQAASLVEMAARNSRRLLVLINDILDFEKLAAGRLELDLKRCSLVELAQEAVASSRGQALQRGVELAVSAQSDQAWVLGDPLRLGQVMANLLSNAIKFSPPGQRVDVEVTTTATKAKVVVTDRGPGVPPEFRNKIFDRFTQAQGVLQAGKGGTGLGLAIARLLVMAHGGTIGFESEPGQGASFFFLLPLAENRADPEDSGA